MHIAADVHLLPASIWVAAVLVLATVIVTGWLLRQMIAARGVDRCWPAIALVHGRPPADGTIHVLLAICDHYEPRCGRPPAEHSDARVTAWIERYPSLFGDLVDSDGRPPRHSFFLPIDEYDADHVERLATLCRQGFGEIEIHHHHDQDSAAGLRERLLAFKSLFHQRHGLLPRDRRTGEVKYAFIHGNWALCDSHPSGHHCGVPDELDVLRETGCYADFTMPSAPSPTQSSIINSIYYAATRPGRRSHDSGTRVGSTPQPPKSLMLVQGPLLLDWRSGRWTPRLENGNLQHNQAPSMRRLDLWLRAAIRVPMRPDWYFVKLHTHGAPEANQQVLLGPTMRRFHQDLAQRAATDRKFKFHYVTAREMYNLARAAEAAWNGTVNDARDYELIWDAAEPSGKRETGVESMLNPPYGSPVVC